MKLYISDLDDTLLNADGQLSDYTRRSLDALLADGLPFTVASARSITSIAPVLDGLDMVLPIIELNGGFVTDLSTHQHLVCNSIPSATVERIVELADAYGVSPFLSICDDDADHQYHRPRSNDGIDQYLAERTAWYDKRFRRVDSFAPHVHKPTVAITIIDRPETTAAMRQDLAREFESQLTINVWADWKAGWDWMTLYDRHATKANAMSQLAEMVGIGLSDVTVFGDQINDISMFEAAGKSVAVANAIDAVKHHAHEVIGPSTDDSVVKYLQAQKKSTDPKPPTCETR